VKTPPASRRHVLCAYSYKGFVSCFRVSPLHGYECTDCCKQ
jgi:hypothetical protein